MSVCSSYRYQIPSIPFVKQISPSRRHRAGNINQLNDYIFLRLAGNFAHGFRKWWNHRCFRSMVSVLRLPWRGLEWNGNLTNLKWETPRVISFPGRSSDERGFPFQPAGGLRWNETTHSTSVHPMNGTQNFIIGSSITVRQVLITETAQFGSCRVCDGRQAFFDAFERNGFVGYLTSFQNGHH